MLIRRSAAALLGSLALLGLLTACSDDDDAADTSDTPAAGESVGGSFPVTVGGVTIDSRPTRIVSLSATATEVLFAIGAGKQVIAVSTSSTYPDEAPPGDLDGIEPNVEALRSKRPDLIVTSHATKSLGGLGIPVLVHAAPASLAEAYDQITELGEASGNIDGAATVVARMKDRIRSIAGTVTRSSPPRTYYYEVDPTYSSVTSKTYVGDLFATLGLENIADRSTNAADPHPQLAAEFIVAASPDLILLADITCCWQSAASAASRAGWASVKAVGNGAVVGLDDATAATWGPRSVDMLATVAAALGRLR